MRLVPFALMPSSPRSPLLAAYNSWSQADFAGCLGELAALDPTLIGADRVEAALLRARSYLRVDRAADAVDALELDAALLEDEDLRCSVRALRGFALVSAGRAVLGLRLLRDAIEGADVRMAHPSIRLEAVYHLAFAHWVLADYDEAENVVTRALQPRVDGVASRAAALRGWVRVAKLRYAEALPFFREAWRTSTASSVRDVAFEASIVHALASYDLYLLDRDEEPRYYGHHLPRVPGTTLDTYRMLVGVVDAWRATLSGDERLALAFAAHTEATDVAVPWRVFALATRAGVARAFGHEWLARDVADVAFMLAMGADWKDSPGESRLALLYTAEQLAVHDGTRAQAMLALYERIGRRVDSRYEGGAHGLHRATEAYTRGLLDGPADVRRGHLRKAYEAFAMMGFQWRGAQTQLVVGREDSPEGRRAYHAARAFVVERFPRSHLARQLHDYTPPIVIPAGDPLTRAQVEIVQALCAGKTPRDVATARGTSVDTVRNQIKQIYLRTDVHSVDELRRRYGGTSA
jgi:DNA-binding CsgD family transcriptional regulator/tetratricopeptide (TPR) repeat protein